MPSVLQAENINLNMKSENSTKQIINKDTASLI